MSDPESELVEFLQDELGENLQFVAKYSKYSDSILFGESYYEEYQARNDTRSREKMRQDAVHRLEQAAVGSDLYAATTESEIQVTDHGTGLHLFPSDTTGYFVWVAPDADLQIPAFTRSCLDRIDVGTEGGE